MGDTMTQTTLAESREDALKLLWAIAKAAGGTYRFDPIKVGLTPKNWLLVTYHDHVDRSFVIEARERKAGEGA